MYVQQATHPVFHLANLLHLIVVPLLPHARPAPLIVIPVIKQGQVFATLGNVFSLMLTLLLVAHYRAETLIGVAINGFKTCTIYQKQAGALVFIQAELLVKIAVQILSTLVLIKRLYLKTFTADQIPILIPLTMRSYLCSHN